MAENDITGRIADYQYDFSGGVDTGRVPTIASDTYPLGLKRSRVAWANNSTMRGGAITGRNALWPVTKIVDSGLYQGGIMAIQSDQFPYIIVSISGKIYRIRVDTDNSVQQIGGAFPNPPTADYGFFEQGEEFVFIQAGDYATKPLIWNMNTEVMIRSRGITGDSNPTSANRNQIPAAGPMCYYQNRLWYAIGNVYTAGDIVGGPSGQQIPDHRDSILYVTENPLAIGGDGFRLPITSGNIRGLKYTTDLTRAGGEGRLFSFTRKAVHWLDVPITRNDWITAGSGNMPRQGVAQRNFGSYNDRSIVEVNGDLFYQSTDGIRSLFESIRYFGQWGNTPASNNVERALRFNDRSLMRFSHGMIFDNRLWESAVPIVTPAGVAFRGVLPLDFDLISSLDEKLPPAWEGLWEGHNTLQYFEGDFGGKFRAFAIVVDPSDSSIWVYECTDDKRFNIDDTRITNSFETPAYTWNSLNRLKQLDGLELWFDKMYGPITVIVEYRPDQYPCWFHWHTFPECQARDCGEDIDAIFCPDYPRTPFCEGFKPSLALPKPIADKCIKQTGRPSTQGYQFQFRITVKGAARFRGILPYALPLWKAPYENIVC